MRIVVLDGQTLNPGDNPWTPVARFGSLTVHDRTPADLVRQRAAGATIVITNKTVLDGETLGALAELRFVAVLATGVNVVDIAAAAARDIPVSNVPEYGADSVAQHAFALLLELANGTGMHAEAVRNGAWSRSQDFCFWLRTPVELSGKTAGVVGFGRIGRRFAEIAHAFGMKILATPSRSRPSTPDYEPFAWADVETIFREADVVSLHCPLTAANERFVDTRLLAWMKPSALLLNTARGGLVDEPALADALRTGAIAGAGLDVLSQEPMPENHPLLAAPNCIITPHIAWATLAARRRMMETTADNIRAFLAGTPINVVNGVRRGRAAP